MAEPIVSLPIEYSGTTESGLLVVLLRASALSESLRGRVGMPLVLPSVLSPGALFHAVLHPLTFHL